MEQSKFDSFTGYLKEKRRLQAMEQPQQGATPLSLLITIAGAPQQEMALRDLQASSGMNFSTFADSLKSLQASGYVTLSGPPSDEVAALTALGQSVAQLTRAR